MDNAYLEDSSLADRISVDWPVTERIVSPFRRLGERRRTRRGGESWVFEGTPPRLFFSYRVCVMRAAIAGTNPDDTRPCIEIAAAIGAGPSCLPRRTRDRHRGFTLIEAMTAITIAAIAGSALLLGTSSSIQTTDDAMRRTIAYGMAQQLMDEVVGCRYMDLGGNASSTTIGPSTSEAAGGTRQLFDDIGDFNGYRCQPPKDAYGIALGADNGQGGLRNAAFQASTAYFLNWRQEVDVYYVSDTDLTTKLASGQTSDYRMVEVRIMYIDPKSGAVQLAQIKRVVTYVAPLSVN
jgi:prepilin-type N-terminal cleavage/methylation domain-containing protein